MTTLNQGLLAGEVKSNLGQVLLADDLKSSLNQILQAEDLESSFTITWTCGTCPASMFAVNCFSYNGGALLQSHGLHRLLLLLLLSHRSQLPHLHQLQLRRRLPGASA